MLAANFGPYLNRAMDSTKALHFSVDPGEQKNLSSSLYGEDTGCQYWIIIYRNQDSYPELLRIHVGSENVLTQISNPTEASHALQFLLTHWKVSSKGEISQCDLDPDNN
ncbi:MAG: hypothetical protein J0L66_06220 [Cytophagales bacterium]|nr:hypothetical protein [Cytophagales bacterium]